MTFGKTEIEEAITERALRRGIPLTGPFVWGAATKNGGEIKVESVWATMYNVTVPPKDGPFR